MWIKQYQQQEYQLVPVPSVQHYFDTHLQMILDDTLWDLSLQVEPRET